MGVISTPSPAATINFTGKLRKKCKCARLILVTYASCLVDKFLFQFADQCLTTKYFNISPIRMSKITINDISYFEAFPVSENFSFALDAC